VLLVPCYVGDGLLFFSAPRPVTATEITHRSVNGAAVAQET